MTTDDQSDLMKISVEVFTGENPLFTLASVEHKPRKICSLASLEEALHAVGIFLAELAEEPTEFGETAKDRQSRTS